MTDFTLIKVFQNTAIEGKGCWYDKYVGEYFRVRLGNETLNDSNGTIKYWLVERQFNRPKEIPVPEVGWAIILKRDCYEIKDEIDRLMSNLGYEINH